MPRESSNSADSASSRDSLRDGDVIHHATFDAEARIRETGSDTVDLEWVDGDLEGRIWPKKQLSTLNRGVGDTITIIEAADPPSESSAGDGDGIDDVSSVAGVGEWLDRTISCPECNQFTRSGHDDAGRPYAECSRCGWTAGVDYLTTNGFYDLPNDGDDDQLGEWLDRTISCPECNQFTRSDHDDTGKPFAECANCGWRADTDYLVENEYYYVT